MSNVYSKTAIAALVASATMAAAPAMAATFGYELSINDPIFNSNSGILNVPDFQLENISDAGLGVLITDFKLTIGDAAFNYDFVRIQNVVTDTGATLTPSLNSVGLVNDGVGDDAIEYTFTGFDEGDVFQFEVDVDPDAGTPTQDFREALFPLAELSVTFSNGTTLSQILNPGDTSPSDYEFIQTVTVAPVPVPLPAGMPLYLGALILGGALTARKRAKRS